MATESAILKLVNLATGESSYSGYANWGEVADANFSFLENALGEVTSKTLASSNVTLTDAEERSLLIKLSGTLGANVSVNTNDRKGFWFVRNDTTGSFSVTFKTTSGTGIVVPQGGQAILVSDGTNMLQADTPATATSLAALIDAATSKTTPVDADTIPLIDSDASNVLKKLTWANIKATLKTYFDTLYTRVTFGLATSDSPQFAGIELGHATDTTLARGAAGFLSVEGKRVPSPASQAAGDILYRGSTEWERLAKGTAGKVLTMNSGATAPEWADLPAASTPNYGAGNAALAYGAVGTYGFFIPPGSGDTVYNPGDTIAGSSLDPAGVIVNGDGVDINTTSPSGTWRCHGYAHATNTTTARAASLWLRTV